MKKLTYLFAAIILSACSVGTASIENNEEANAALEMKIDGMVCEAGCVSTIKHALDETPGVVSIDINFEGKEAVVEFDNSIVHDSDIINKVESLGEGMYKVPSSKTICKANCDESETNSKTEASSSSPVEPDVSSSNGYQIPNVYELINKLIR